jgi:hypothetical protein
MHNWVYASYEFSLTPTRKTSLADNALEAEILQHAIGRAARHGDLDGERFFTASGLRGILHHAELEHGTRDWYFSIPVESTGNAVIVRVVFRRGSMSAQDSFMRELARSIRFLGAKRSNSTNEA